MCACSVVKVVDIRALRSELVPVCRQSGDSNPTVGCHYSLWLEGTVENMCFQPHAASWVERLDPLHFLAGCRKRQLNQALSVLSLSLGF